MNEALESHPAFADLPWLRKFAATLARDDDEADELVQETLIAAWQQEPETRGRGFRPWLSGVLRNRSRMGRRSAERRRRRESNADVPQEVLDQESIQARLEVLENLVGALRELGKDEQAIVVRRYFDEETPTEIAASLGIPAATVRSKIQRSLRKLRSTLDERHGGRAAWAALAIRSPEMAPPSPASSTPTMSIPVKIAAFALTTSALGVGGYYAAQSPSDEPGAPAAATIAPPPSTERLESSRPLSNAQHEWSQRQVSIREALEARPPSEPERGHRPVLAFREAVDGCAEEAGLDAALTVSVHEIGAPDIGTIITAVELVDHNIEDPELRECITESMYAYVGPAPDQPFERTAQITGTLGEKNERSTATLVRAIAGAHSGEVRFCQGKHPGSEGRIVFELEFSEPGKPDAVRTTKTEVSADLTECVAKAVGRWMFPALGSTTAELDFEFPMVEPAR